MAIGGGNKTLTITTKFEADATGYFKAVDTISLKTKEAQAASTGFGRSLSEAFDRAVGALGKLGEGFSNAIGGVDKFAKAMAPWNQAVELAGKVTRFAEAGLDAYAKTSKGAAKEVEALTTEFKHYRDVVMASVGQLTVELLKPAVAFEEQRKKLMEIGNTPAFRLLYGSDGKRLGLRGMIDQNLGPGGVERLESMGLIKVTRETNPFAILEGAAKSSFGELKNQLDSAADHWDTRGKKLFDDMAAGFASLGKGGKGGTRAGKFSDVARLAGTDTAGRPLGFSPQPLGSLADMGPDRERGILDEINARHAAAFEEMTSREQRFRDSFTSRNESYLESLFGPIEEFNAYGAAFDTLSAATTSAMSAWISGSVSLGVAIKKGIGDALGALASQLAVEALKHGAYSIGSLAFGDLAGAGKHAAAATAFGLGAVAAATAAKKIGGSVAAEASAQKTEASGGGSAANDRDHRGSGASSGGGEGRTRTVVVYADPFAEGTPGTRRRNARKVLERAKGGDNWEDN